MHFQAKIKLKACVQREIQKIYGAAYCSHIRNILHFSGIIEKMSPLSQKKQKQKKSACINSSIALTQNSPLTSELFLAYKQALFDFWSISVVRFIVHVQISSAPV